MRILAEVTEEKEEQPIDGEIAYEKRNYWLLHWGIQHEIIELEEGRIAAVNYTVAICQDYETGVIRCFRPEQLKILGREVKE